MPCDYTIDVARGLVRSRAWGVLTDDDLATHQARLAKDPDFSPEFNQIYDFRDVTNGQQVSTEVIRTLAAQNPFGARSRRVLLASSRAAFGLARMFEILTSSNPDEIRVILDEVYLAEQWLGIRPQEPSSP